MSHRDTGPIPNRWLNCPRKAIGLMAQKFLAFKTPLGSSFNEKVPEENRFTPSMLFVYMKSLKVGFINVLYYYFYHEKKQFVSCNMPRLLQNLA